MKNKFFKILTPIIYGLISIGILISFWEYAAFKGWGYTNIFPPPSKFLAVLINNDFKVGIGSSSPTLYDSIIASIFRVISGLLLGTITGIFVGSILSVSKWTKRFLLPIVRLFAPIAPIAWIPLALVMFGIGNQAAIFIVFMGVFFIMIIATINAISIVPQNFIDTAKTLGINNSFSIWLLVIIPSILPGVFTMLRINFLTAWMAVLAAEMTGLRDGLGAIIITGRNLFDNNLILLGMFLIGIVGFCFDFFLKLFQDKFLWWDKLTFYGNKNKNE